MLTGFNTNVRHRGLLLHVQTEDSGRAHPHVITHLFHGGTILASEKVEYGDRLGSESLTAEVRALMEGQHRAMLKSLRRGDLDARLVERLGGDVFAADANAVTAAGDAASRGLAAAQPEHPPDARVDAAPDADGRRLDEIVLEYLEQRAPERRRP